MLSLVLCVALALLLVAYLLKEVHYRRFRQYAVIPQLKPSLLLGHMKILDEFNRRGLPDQHIENALMEIWKSLNRPPVILFDLRPMSYPLLVVTSHAVAEQITSASTLFPWSVTKSPTIKDTAVVLGENSVLTFEGETWKATRKRFNPGFAHGHMVTLLPVVMDKTWQFLRHVDSYAKTGEEFSLAKLLTNLTFDVIGAVTLDYDFGAQLDNAHQSQFIQVYQLLLSTFLDEGIVIPNPKMRLRQWWWGRKMTRYLTDMVVQKLADYKAQDMESNQKSRSIVALASKDMDTITPDRLTEIVDSVKTFLFAGHDTTSIVLQWVIYELTRHPRVLEAVRAELDDVLGRDASPAAVRDKLLSGGGSDAMGRLVYMSAVIKETMRLYPPASSVRMAKPGTGFQLHMPDSNDAINVDGMILWVNHKLIQADPAVYGDTAEDFVPERWLGNAATADADDRVAAEKPGAEAGGIPAAAWRPFERGPRNCIGQALANIEMRVILALVVRRYDFTKVGLGELDLDANGRARLNAKGEYEVKSKLYNTSQLTARPIDGMMMKVKLNPKASFDL